jgi:integrase
MPSTSNPWRPDELSIGDAQAILAGVDPAVREALFAGLNARQPAHRSLIGLLAGVARHVDPTLYEAARSESVLTLEANRALLWVRWATLSSPIGGGGVALDESGLIGLPSEVLAVGATAFIGWLKTSIPETHVLLQRNNWDKRIGSNGAPGGYRRTAGPVGSDTLRGYRRAVQVWAAEAGVDVAVVEGALLSIGTRTEAPPVRRVELSLDDVLAMIDVLDREGIVMRGMHGIRSRAWHARQKCALLIQLWGVLRISELTRLELGRLRQRGDTDLTIRLARTKTGAGRDVELGSRGDVLCPITALAQFLRISQEAGYDHQGVLLPGIRAMKPVGEQGACAPTVSMEISNFRRVARAAGVLTPEIEADDQLCLGTHALRRYLPTVAGNAGESLAFIVSIGGGGWAPGSSVPGERYVAMHSTTDTAADMVDIASADVSGTAS